ncbi:unnamed protein product [Cercopithifilaria johnstoni]|uniref:Uncharacterized protein n=1 Tax=Cercopithifilaria johnstoni TaxID=2874296 RepID=A0A8J2M275_9BILA|nr:unnamed protein product [Cercopithifilaria johnstoni]
MLIIFHLIVLPGSYSQPDVVIVNADATDGGDAGDRNYRRYSRRQAQLANNRALVYKRLSSSAAEVQLSHRDDEKYSLNAFHSSEILESTHSLTYLEWVHERQTRRMRTRSEWFLLPAPSAKDSGTSQPNTSVLSSTSMLQPCSQFDDSIMGSFDGCMGNPNNINECLVNKTYEGAISPSLADISGQLPPAPQPVTAPTSRMAGGIVRRRSWRTHYVRPDRIVKGDNKERGSSEVAIISSRSTPLYRRNVPHTSSRSLPSAGRPIVLPSSSLMEFQQQRQRSRSTSPAYEKGYVNTGSGSSTSHVKGSKAVLQSKLVHF